jgi:hypothetical protein
MKLKAQIWEYLKAIVQDGKSLIGLAVSVVLGVLAWFLGDWIKPGTPARLYITLSVAAVCLVVVTFRAWKKERDAIELVRTLKNAPKVYLDYQTKSLMMDPHPYDAFSITCTEADAVNVAFDPFEVDGKRIEFNLIPQLLVKEGRRSVKCRAATVDQQFCDLLATACQKHGKSEMSTRIRITYQDGAGGKFETVSTITYDAQKGTRVTKVDGPKLLQ